MTAALDLFGALAFIGGVGFALILLFNTNFAVGWIALAYALGGIGSSLLFFGLSNVLRRLEQIQVMTGKPSR